MAVRHDSELALTQHTFGRSGDLWKFMLPRLRELPIARDVFQILDIKTVWQRGFYRVPIPCPRCGVDEISKIGAFPLAFISSGVVDQTAHGQSQPDKIQCHGCAHLLDPTELLADKSAAELDALVSPGGALKGWRLPEQLFIAAEVDGKHRVDFRVPAALNRLLGPQFEMTQRLCRVQALTIEQAREVVEQHHKDMPWRMVEIDRDLQPLDPHWFRATEPQLQLSV